MNVNQNTRLRIIGLVSVGLIAALTIYAYTIRHQIFMLERYGYPGVFLVEFIANASVAVPIPGSLATAAVAPLLNPFLLAAVASAGAAIGELFGYLAGLGGSTLVENVTWLERIERWMEKYGGVVILLMAAIPNPLFDTAGLAAGALKMHPARFFFWCWGGKLINRLIITLGGAALINQFFPL